MAARRLNGRAAPRISTGPSTATSTSGRPSPNSDHSGRTASNGAMTGNGRTSGAGDAIGPAGSTRSSTVSHPRGWRSIRRTAQLGGWMGQQDGPADDGDEAGDPGHAGQ